MLTRQLASSRRDLETVGSPLSLDSLRLPLLYAVALLATVFGRVTPLRAQAPNAGVQAVPAEAPPPSSAGIFPLSGVHRGLHGTAWTVFEGTKPEPMGVEILGVLHNAVGPGEDMILARLTGTKAEYTGVVAGMSGSPVYIDGKLVGALAYRIGQFSKEPIAGITPIERMLEVRDLGTKAALLADNSSGKEIASLGKPVMTGAAAGEAPELAAAAAGGQFMRPIDTPLVFNGFSPAALALWKQQSPVSNLAPVAGLGGSGTGGAPVQPEPLIPGSAVSALLVEGDLEIAATCTVTYVDPTRLLACGHPITQFGPVSMPMTKADVVATLPSPLNAFKIVNTTDVVGSFTQDRQNAIGGVLGQTAHMIPVTVRIRDGVSKDDAASTDATTRTLKLRVVDQAQLTPTAVLVSVFQGLEQSNQYAEQSSYRVHGTVHIAGFPDMHIDSLSAPSAIGPANLLAALEVGTRFSKLYDNASRRAPIESVDVEVSRLSERQSAQLTGAQAERTVVHAGERVTVRAMLQPWQGPARVVPVTITLPRSLPNGNLRLLVSDGDTLDRVEGSSRPAGATLDLAATIAQLNSLHADDVLYVTLLTPDAQAVVDGRVLGTLPASMANVYEPLRENQKATLSGESVLEVGKVPVETALSGQQVIQLRVE